MAGLDLRLFHEALKVRCSSLASILHSEGLVHNVRHGLLSNPRFAASVCKTLMILWAP